MAYQVPKSNHPWRNYANKITEDDGEEKEIKNIKSVHTFICELAGSYETIEIYSSAYGKDDKFYLSDLPQSKQASWIVSMLRKYYRQY